MYELTPRHVYSGARRGRQLAVCFALLLVIAAALYTLGSRTTGGTVPAPRSTSPTASPSLPDQRADRAEPPATAKAKDSKTAANHGAKRTKRTTAAPAVRSYLAKDAPTFSVEYPKGWTIVHDGLSYGPFERTEWRQVGGARANISVDYAPNYQLTPQEAAERARARVQQASDYQEILFVATTAHGLPAWKWIYRLGDNQIAHYFVEACGSAYGVLGSTPAKSFGVVASTFSHVADSLAPKCVGGAPTPPPPAHGFDSGANSDATGAAADQQAGDQSAQAALDRLTGMLQDVMNAATNVDA